MTQDLILYHIKRPGVEMPLPDNHWHMATCLRSIVISDQKWMRPKILEKYERKEGNEAYEFLLSIICGLESPMLGETEILGQFKEFCRVNHDQFSSQINEIVTQLKRHAKRVRTQYLQNLGCTSYGSLLRKNLKDQNGEFILIGAGALTQDIVPWFAKLDVNIKVFTRSPEKYDKLEQAQSNLKLYSLDEISNLNSQGILVVAAPLSAKELHQSLDMRAFKHIYDLRGNCLEDPIDSDCVTPLKALFSSIEKNKHQAKQIREKATQAVEHLTVNLSLFEKQRPFGWEDLWTYA